MSISKDSRNIILPEETIDASNRVLGRLATEVASKLLGKDLPSFDSTIAINRPIKIVNASKIVLTGRKADQKVYYHHSGYPGGLRERSFKEQMNLDSTEVIRHAVRGMLPKNRLLVPRLKNLSIKKYE